MKKLKKWCSKQLDIYRGVDFPIDRIIGKSFVPASRLPHRQLLERFEAFGRDGFDWKETAYFNRIAGGTGLPNGGFETLPEGLDFSPSWWLMPWAWYPGKERAHDYKTQERRALQKIAAFLDLYESIKNDGYKMRVGGAIRGYILEHPDHGFIFSQIDGHHRLAILDFLSEIKQSANLEVRVFPIKVIRRSEVLRQPECLRGLGCNIFSERDALKLFDHPFHQLGFETGKSI